MTASIDDIIDTAHRLATDVERQHRELLDRVNHTLSVVPGPLSALVEPVRRQLDEIGRLYHEVHSEAWSHLEHAGNPSRLNHVSQQWAAGVADRLTDIASAVERTRLRTDNYWAGTAAAAYEENIEEQAKKLSELRDLAVRLSESTDAMQDAIQLFWIAMSAALVELSVGLVGAAVAASTIVGIPPALAAVAAICANVLIWLGAAAVVLAGALDSVENAQRAIGQELRDTGSTWPVPRFADLTERGAAGWQPHP